MNQPIRCDESPQWLRLRTLYENEGRRLDMRQAFATDAQRYAHFSQTAPHVFADLSKNLWDRQTESLLIDMAAHCGLEAHRDAMLRGDPINTTEQRAVLHTLLRRPRGLALPGDRPEVADDLVQVHATLDAMLAYAEAVRADEGITDVVNIGIGGSDLGPHMAVQALEAYRAQGKRLHFVSNIDGHELHAVLQSVKPERTLFLVASKTFTTVETMTNARSALAWFHAQGGRDVARHFAALTTNVEAARELGITTT
ncbi:MAG TPA: glucose-6-phosphate isomerase, partial [Giesbergeria sp.]|nr:glucose-6-phosphate isomerase [Giesbergeria sp.]